VSLAIKIAVLVLAYLAIALPAAVLIGRTLRNNREVTTKQL